MEHLTAAVRELTELVEAFRVEVHRRTRVLWMWTLIVAVSLLLAVAGGATVLWTLHGDEASTARAFQRTHAALIDTCAARQQRDAATVARDKKLRDAEAGVVVRARQRGRGDDPIVRLLQQQVDAYDESLRFLSTPSGPCATRYG